MTTKRTSTRRSFLKNGALLAAPLAAAAPVAVLADDDLKSRLAKLENEAAIRELHRKWLRQISDGNSKITLPRATDAPGAVVRSIAPDHGAEPEAIEIEPRRNSASGRFHCVVEIESILPRDSTLAQMAHAQGSGFIRRMERRTLKVEYTKSGGAWTVTKAEFATV